jgi:hypothetical protein
MRLGQQFLYQVEPGEELHALHEILTQGTDTYFGKAIPDLGKPYLKFKIFWIYQFY